MGIVLAGLLLLTPGPRWTAQPPDTTTQQAPPRSASRGGLPTTRHTVRFGVGYQPGPGLRLMGLYRYAGLPSGYVTTTAGWSEQLFGSAGYTHVIDLNAGPWQRLTATVAAFSRYQPDRLLDDVVTDERRTGGRLRLGAVARPTLSRQLRVHLDAQRARIRLDPQNGPASAHGLTTLEGGGQYTAFGRTIVPPFLFGLQARAGWDENAGRYVTLTGAARVYRSLGAGWGALVDARARWVSADAPRFAQASFGGMTGVRGYRMDTALGRRLWTVQNELWAPLPGTHRRAAGLAGLVGRRLRLAAFFDVGGLARNPSPRAFDARTGLGLGLRVLLGALTLRIDWGHRTPAVLDGHLRGDLYVSARSPLDALLP